MAKSNKEKPIARILMRKLRNMVELQHFEDNDTFIVVFSTGTKKLWIEWDAFAELFNDFKAAVDVTKHK